MNAVMLCIPALPSKSLKTRYEPYRTASVPYATPTQTTNSAQLIAMRNQVLSNNELYFASNIVIFSFHIYRRQIRVIVSGIRTKIV